MASALGSCSARAAQRAGVCGRQQCAAIAVPRPAAAVQQPCRNLQLRAAVEDEVIDLDQVTLQGIVPAGDAQEEPEQEYSLEELVEAAEATHYNNLAIADIEAAFLEGTADKDVSSYLAGLQEEAETLLMEGKGRGAEAAAEALAAAAAELDEAGEVVEAPVEAELGVKPLNQGPVSALERLTNEEAIQARKVVSALKLSKQELQNDLLPEDWDATTVEWFTDREKAEMALPEYRLVFLWMDKVLAVGVDQVYACGNSAPLTEYFMWPRRDAWDDLKMVLEARPWISDAEKIALLNRLTQVINFWTGSAEGYNPDGTLIGDAQQPSVDEARTQFPDCAFFGGV